MENKNVKPQNNNNAFENLKNLSSLLSSNELNSFVGAIGKAKRALDNYCKVLKEKEAYFASHKEVAQPKVEETPVVVQNVEKKVVQENVERKPFVPRTQNVVGQNSQNPRYNNQNQGNSDRPFVPRGDHPYTSRPAGDRPYTPRPTGDRPYTSRPTGGDRPYTPRPAGDRPYAPKPAGDRPYTPRPAGERPYTPRVAASAKVNNLDKPVIYTKPERTFGNKNKTKSVDEKKELNKKAKIRMGYVELDSFDNEERMGRVKVKGKKQKQVIVPEKIEINNAVITTDNLTVKILSEKIGKPAVDIIKKFMMLGMMPNVNSVIDFATAELVASEFGVTLEQKVEKNYEEQLEDMFNDVDAVMSKRPPIVTVMGHVDHGKTSLLDAIRKTNVIAGEAGGITQHIGAYSVETKGNKITFIDTPGHAAFTSMRARGAKVTDVAILVVAADDGIMPQTVEAINHIKAAKVPMIVAINKMDKPTANPERIKQQLTEYDIVPEEWGGDVICVPISAKNGDGIDKLLEMVLLVSDVADLSANANLPASGYVIESKIDKGRGVVATVLIRNGSLHVGDYIVSGVSCGRVRAMMDYTGSPVDVASPSMAVSILGFDIAPEAGDKAYVVDEKMAKNIVNERSSKLQVEKANQNNNITLEDFLKQSADHEIKTLNLIVKADVKGSVEALKQTLEKIQNDEVKVKCIHASVGGINESDVLLAQASNAIIIAFNVRPEAKAKVLAERNGVDIKYYRVIYEAVDDITNAITGMLAPKFEEEIIGHAEIRHIYKISSVGTIAGCYVKDGNINRGAKVRLLRSNIVVADSEIETLQQQKDEVKTIKFGYECGIKLKNYNDIKEGDIIEAYEIKQL